MKHCVKEVAHIQRRESMKFRLQRKTGEWGGHSCPWLKLKLWVLMAWRAPPHAQEPSEVVVATAAAPTASVPQRLCASPVWVLHLCCLRLCAHEHPCGGHIIVSEPRQDRACVCSYSGNKDVQLLSTDYLTYIILEMSEQIGPLQSMVLKLYSKAGGCLWGQLGGWVCHPHLQPLSGRPDPGDHPGSTEEVLRGG